MDTMPEVPGPAAREATTQRITARVQRGWPRLGDPVVRFRGQFCYVAITRPRSGWRRSEPPSPILRLRYQGSIDRWNIAICKYSTETYTEAELPATFGPRTGTPEQGIDYTFPLYAGPSRITD